MCLVSMCGGGSHERLSLGISSCRYGLVGRFGLLCVMLRWYKGLYGRHTCSGASVRITCGLLVQKTRLQDEFYKTPFWTLDLARLCTENPMCACESVLRTTC